MDRERQIQRALTAIRSKEVASVREAARRFCIPRSTLQHRLASTRSHAEAKKQFQRLTVAEEASIVRVALQMQVWGWALTIKTLETFANYYLKAKNDLTPLGRQWYSNFLVRHPELKLQRPHNLDQQRKDGASCDSLKEWSETYQRIRLCCKIASEDVDNMDEGLMKGIGDNANGIISHTNEISSTTLTASTFQLIN